MYALWFSVLFKIKKKSVQQHMKSHGAVYC